MGKDKLSKEQRKNAAAVAAFGSGKPPEQQSEQQSEQPSERQRNKVVGGVRRQGETKAQFRARMAGTTQPNDNSDIDAVFRGIQQTRTKVHKGLSGMQLNPDGTDPGNSFDRFMRQNPHLGGAAQRQAQYDQQARGNAYKQAAQNSLMRAQEQQPTSKSVVGADGYRSIFDQQGNVVGTTAPVGEKGSRVFDDALGEMVPMDAWSQRKNYVQGTKGMNATAMQQAARKSMTSKPNGIDQIFGRGTKQTSPSGVAGDGLVEPTQLKGAPGGELFGPPNPYAMGPNAGPQYTPMGPNDGPQYTPMMPNDGPQYTPMMPNDGPQRPADFGPQLPYSGGEQLMALKRLYGFGGNTNPTATALEGTWSNIFPGRKDYEYLRQLFPGLVHPQAGSGQVMNALAQMYQNPAYQALFPQVNQSEFYQ